MLDVGLHLQDHPPPRNGGMAMAIPMTTLEDGLQDEARKNANIILTGFLFTVLLLFWLINSILYKQTKHTQAKKQHKWKPHAVVETP